MSFAGVRLIKRLVVGILSRLPYLRRVYSERQQFKYERDQIATQRNQAVTERDQREAQPEREHHNYFLAYGNVCQDRTKNCDYERLLKEEIHEHNNIEVTKDLRIGGVHDLRPWHYWFEYLTREIWKTNWSNEVIHYANRVPRPRILSLGCGHEGHELAIARSLTKPYAMIALDLAAETFREAEKRAKAMGLNIMFEAADLNFIKLKQSCFDIVFAHASLHHLLNFENLFSQIHKGLKKEGHLIVLDIIGKNNGLFWKENVDFAREIVRTMPDKYKKGANSVDEIIPPYVERSGQQGMEGISQEELEEQILRYFIPARLFKYGSFVRLVCTNKILGNNFNLDIVEDREYLRNLFQLDLEQVRKNALRPTEIFGVFLRRDAPSI